MRRSYPLGAAEHEVPVGLPRGMLGRHREVVEVVEVVDRTEVRPVRP